MFSSNQHPNKLVVKPVPAVRKPALWRVLAMRAACDAVLIGKLTY